MSGNLCRCGAHNGIVGAIAERMPERRSDSSQLACDDVADAVRRGGARARYLGGARLVDLMRETSSGPRRSSMSAPGDAIEETRDGGC